VSRRLYLLRHAKSNWDDPEQSDHERPLSGRGRRATGMIRAYLEARHVRPELILCSSARRTRETLDGLGLQSTALIEHRLYGAGAEDLIERLRLVSSDVSSVMLIGHNPALQILALRLARGESPSRMAGQEGLAEIGRKLPTGALVTLEVAGEWAGLDQGSAELVDYMRPKTL